MDSEITSSTAPTMTAMASSLLSNGATEPTKPTAVTPDHRHIEFWSILDPCKYKMSFKTLCKH